MGRDETKLILGLKGLLEEAVHELEGGLTVLEESAAVNALQVQVEVALCLAGLDQPRHLGRLLGEQETKVDGLHGVDGHLLAVPLHRLGYFCRDAAHNCCLSWMSSFSSD